MSRKILKQPILSTTRRGSYFNPDVKPVKFESMAGLRVPVKRNQACPCGSGRKYKHCCRTIGRAMRPTQEAQSDG